VRHFPYFRGVEQHDAVDYLQHLLDNMHSEVSTDSSAAGTDAKPPISLTDLAGPQLLNMSRLAKEDTPEDLYSPVNLFLTGQQLTVVKCEACGVYSAKFTPYSVLSLPIVNSVTAASAETIEEAFDLYHETDDLVGDDQFHCSKCDGKRDAMMKHMLTINPDILVVHLKRFTFADGAPVKLDQMIGFGMELSLPDLQRTVEGGDTALYELQSVVYHCGTMTQGHYTAASRRRGSWYLFDDAKKPTRARTADEIVNQDAYILFYRRVPTEAEIGEPS
jgi:ubiquitin C-terminal hydrolase